MRKKGLELWQGVHVDILLHEFVYIISQIKKLRVDLVIFKHITLPEMVNPCYLKFLLISILFKSHKKIIFFLLAMLSPYLAIQSNILS